jgi:prepilin-type N-terminal cleavage/methylation domain-containing protein/prepilin-type processing-associated H-X9-DG protein
VLRSRQGFTLVELLVVVAIIAALSAILFPVFAAAKGSANRAACVSNLRQISRGTQLYVADYDDRLMPVNHQPANDATSRNDRTWVQSLLPYVRNFSVFRCPSDHSSRPKLEATYDQDLVPGDTDSQYYTASLRSNYGYNYHNLSPIVQEGASWVARPKLMSEIYSTSGTIIFVDSVWGKDNNGSPAGGGNWLVVPPCRYYKSSVDSFTGSSSIGESPTVYTPVIGWKVGVTSTTSGGGGGEEGSESANINYGNAYPWHSGRMNVARLDGSIRLMSTTQLGVGCDVRDEWQGQIGDPGAYLWDAR